MRVLLIKPSVRGFRVEIGRHVPIGPDYLASCLRDHGHDVTLFDALSFTEDNHVVDPADYTEADKLKLDRHPRWRHLVHWGASQDRLARAIEQADPQVVGISCMFTPYYESAYEAARLAREIAPDALAIFGGPFQHPVGVLEIPAHQRGRQVGAALHERQGVLVGARPDDVVPLLGQVLADPLQLAGHDRPGFDVVEGQQNRRARHGGPLPVTEASAQV